MDSYNNDIFHNYEHLGFSTPYFYRNEDGFIVVQKNLKQILSSFNGNREIDVLAVIELLNKNYILGDRTLIKEISRVPWMAKPNNEFRDWSYVYPPKHFENIQDEKKIAKKMFSLICEEILTYTNKKNHIGLLLSGGMDSRIVAGILDFLIRNGMIPQKSVCALTWGNINSRDVVYASLIAKKLKWDWKHYEVTADHLLQNIEETAIRGCEFSPVHLHALPQIRDDKNLDCILAASYGDSIGRGEYSGKKVTDLKSIEGNFKNTDGFIKSLSYRGNYGKWNDDVLQYHKQFPQEKLYQQIEQDYQLHYMRRMLNPCMDMISEKMPFYQVFTSPNVFGYMWSLHPKLRTDKIYEILLSYLNKELRDIPWARTGLKYGEKTGSPDKFDKEHHSYHKLITYDIFTQINDLILNGNLQRVNFFNLNSISNTLKLVKKYPFRNFNYVEKLIWLASFSRMIELYNLKSNQNIETVFYDNLKGNILFPVEYISKVYYRNLRNVFLK